MSGASTVSPRGPVRPGSGLAEPSGRGEPAGGDVPGAPGRDIRGVARVPVLRPLRVLPVLRPLAAAGLLLAVVAIQSPRSLWLTEALAVRASRVPQPAFGRALRADDLGTAISTILTRAVAIHTTYPEIVRIPGYAFAFLTVLLLASAARRLARLVAPAWRPPAVARPASIGVAAGLLAAFHGMLGTAAATVGPGALTAFAVALAVDLLMRVLDAGHWVTSIAAGMAGAFAIGVHLSAALAVLAAFATLAVLPGSRLPRSRLAVVVGLAAAGGALILAETLGTASARSQWAGTPGQTASLSSAMTFLGGGAGPGDVTTQPGKALSRLATLALVLLIGVALVHLARMLRVTGRSAGSFVLALPLAMLLVPVVGAGLAGAAGVGGAAGRNMVAAVPGVVLLAAIELYRSGGPSSAWLGISEWRNGYSAAAAAATGALLGTLLVGVGGVSTLPCVGGRCAVEQWSVAVSRIETLRFPGDVSVVYSPETVLPFDLAATRVASRLAAAGEAPLPRVVSPSSVTVGLAESAEPDTATRVRQVGSAYAATAKAPRVWLVLSHVTGARAVAAADLDKALKKKYGHAFEWKFRGVTVILFTHSALKPVPAED